MLRDASCRCHSEVAQHADRGVAQRGTRERAIRALCIVGDHRFDCGQCACVDDGALQCGDLCRIQGRVTEKLVEAGRLLAREPQAMQLRYFAALHDIASERSSTIVFPLPTDLLTHLVPRPEGAK